MLYSIICLNFTFLAGVEYPSNSNIYHKCPIKNFDYICRIMYNTRNLANFSVTRDNFLFGAKPYYGGPNNEFPIPCSRRIAKFC